MSNESPFKAKFNGHCAAGTACKRGGRISKGELIRWSRTTHGRTWHDECDSVIAGPSPTMTTQGKAEAPEPVPVTSNALANTLADALAPLLAGRVQAQASVSAEEVAALVETAIAPLRKRVEAINDGPRPTVIEIKNTETGEVKDLGLQHKQFPLLVKVVQARQSDGHRLNVWMTGPAGSGKTTAAFNAAKALGLEYAFTGAIDTPYPLLGFVDAHGKVIRTPFRERYESGGVFLFDEYDGSHPSATLPFNAALANGHCAFPDAIVKRHPDFVAIAAANTWGLGGTAEYVGRNRLDAASLDRFVCIEWEVDEALETATVGNTEWVTRVQGVRKAAKRAGIKVLITPRASYFGAALLAAGVERKEVERITLQKGITESQWESIG